MPVKRKASFIGATSERPSRERNGFGGEHVAEIQRARMLAAMTEVVAERGASNTTVAHVVARSGVSRRTFYETFTDREDCFLAAFEDGVARAGRYVLHSYDPSARWPERIRTALLALLQFLEVEHGVGRLLFVESLGAGPKAMESRRDVLARMSVKVDEGRSEAKPADAPPPLTAEGVVGAVFSVVHARISEEPHPRLVELINDLMSMIVLPYLGAPAARREFRRPLPKRGSRVPRMTNPLKELEMRLTYRTVRVLMAVAARPGGSNRLLAEEAGITDQGQISKLLARLDRLGLIINERMGSARGAPNAWALTERGLEVQRAVGGQILVS
jgi:AcrR family transcriptional regulator